MAEETQVVRPLTSDEVKDAIAQTIAEKVRESLNTTCWLYGMSWPKFKATWRVDVTLENFGEERPTSVNGVLHPHEIPVDEGIKDRFMADHARPTDSFKGGRDLSVEGEIPYTPPNVVRKKHGMAIPTIVKRDDGSTEQKAVMFKRKPGRPKVNDEE